MDAEQFRAAGYGTIDDIIEYFKNTPTQRVLPDIDPGYLRPLIPENPPEDPEPWSQIQPDIDSKIKPGLTQWQSPNFMAFFPAGVTFPSILGEMYSAAFNAPAFNWLCSPACTELEVIVLDWMAKALALPKCFHSTSPTLGGGVIHGSASEAITTVIVAARERHVREQAESEGLKEGTIEWEDRVMELRPKLVALGSDQTHSSTSKGALIAGTRYRSVPTKLEDNMELTGPALRSLLEDCERQGLVPFYLTATMGTTNTCAVDRFEEIKAVLKEKKEWQRIWVHIDAAYAGASLVAEEYQHIASTWGEGIDSFDMNMHKWLLVNFDASCLFVRNRLDLTRALDVSPTYLRNSYSETGTVTDYRNWQIPLGRRFRALKIWFVMRTYGLSGMKAHIRKGVGLGNVFSGLVKGRSDLFEIVTEPGFGLTVLRVKGLMGGNGDTNGHGHHTNTNGAETVLKPDPASTAITREVYETILSRGEIYLTSSVVAGVYVIRLVSGSTMAEEKYVRRAFEILVEVTEQVRAKGIAN
ncbi:hypothetical protein FQN54_002755 [Arachnomyces sp. PD_36]|nr:hypothetical protein FQN54_002755 [Arachnomyces sp. PD_36]